MRLQVRPLHNWPPERKTSYDRSNFATAWTKTEQLLGRELDMLRAKNVVLEMDVTDGQIKVDGTLRGTSNPATGRVALAFDTKEGPVKMHCSRFRDWRDNVRALALSLEALRRVDRYGVTSRGEQYAGWRQLPSGRAIEPMDVESAWRVVADLAQHTVEWCMAAPTEAFRLATFAAHPDHGGTDDAFVALQEAKGVLS